MHEPVSISEVPTQEKAAGRAEQAAKLISLASLLLLFVAVALYTGLSIIGWNAYIAAAALFSAGLAGYPLLILLTHAVAPRPPGPSPGWDPTTGGAMIFSIISSAARNS